MGAFLVRRLALSVFCLFGVLVVMYLLMHAAPIDPARQYAGMHATPERITAVTEMLGLDRSVPVQLATYIKNFFTGDWGVSLMTKRPVLEDIRRTLPYTLELVGLAMMFVVVVGIPLGVVSAKDKDLLPDHASRMFAVGLIAIPTFWLALALQYILSSKLGLLPLSGPFSYDVMLNDPVKSITGFPLIDALITGNFTGFWDHAAHLVLPVLALAGMALGTFQRIMRASLVETLTEDHIVAKRSYGLPERSVLYSHALKNSSGPMMTILALDVAYLIANTFLIESIFAWPGIGAYIAAGVQSLDYPVIMSVTLVSAVCFLIMNTLADIAIAAADPRIRLG